jgi:hypothetical protein
VPSRSACTPWRAARGALQRLHARPDHDHDAVEHRLAGGDQVVQHGPAGDRVEGLRQGRPHPGAEAGGEDDGGGGHTTSYPLRPGGGKPGLVRGTVTSCCRV